MGVKFWVITPFELRKNCPFQVFLKLCCHEVKSEVEDHGKYIFRFSWPCRPITNFQVISFLVENLVMVYIQQFQFSRFSSSAVVAQRVPCGANKYWSKVSQWIFEKHNPWTHDVNWTFNVCSISILNPVGSF